MTPEVAVYRRSDGALLHVTSRVNAPATDDVELASVVLPGRYSEETFVWSATSRGMIEDTAKLRAQQLAALKAEAERRKMMALSPGGAKKTQYAEQAAEVRFFWTLGGTVQGIISALGLWSAERRLSVFPLATADAAAFGDTLDKAIARFSAGMATSASFNAICAAENKASADLRKATSVAGIRAASAAFFQS